MEGKGTLNELLEAELRRALPAERYAAADECMERLDELMREPELARIDRKAVAEAQENLLSFLNEAGGAHGSPLHAFVKLLEAQGAYLLGRFEEAERIARSLSLTESAALRRRAVLVAGASQIAQGKRKAARLTFAAALSENEDDAEAALRVGQACFAEGALDEALAYFERAAAGEDEEAALRAKGLTALALFKQRRFKSAVRALSGHEGGFPFERLRHGALLAKAAMVASGFNRDLSLVESEEVDRIDRMIAEAFAK